jgi:acyl carrier protein
MIFERAIAHKIRDVSDRARARYALGKHVGKNVRIVGLPSVVREGELRVGDDVVIVSSPAPVTIVAHAGASIEIGDGVVIESGAVIRAQHKVVILPGAHVEAGAIIDDDTSTAALVNTVHDTARASHDRIREVIASVVESARDLDPAADVRSVAGWDSLAALRVVVALEKELDVMLPHDLFVQPRTLASIADVANGER